ncbi:MAG TPA: hypothetical protein VD706_02110, partial [Candidatus Saccharimonadales bacterium]|nr:hypothetical protein [Candidatus Saccharimonadales bacterium]
MGRITFPDILAKFGLAQHKPQFHVATAAAQSILPQMIVVTPVATSPSHPKKSQKLDFMHRYWLGIFALLFLAVGAGGILLGGAYWSAHKVKPIATTSKPIQRHAVPQRGPNMSVPAEQLPATLEKITAQPISLAVGTRTVPLDPATIKSWLHIATDKKTRTSYIHLNEN